jgi:hypothetical protein
MTRSRIVPLESLQQFAAVNLLLDPGHIPGPKIAPNCVEVRWLWALADGKLAFNVTHARYSPPYPGNTTLANAIQSSLNSLFTSSLLQAGYATAVQLRGVDLRDINVANQPIIPSTGASLGGTDTNSSLPDEVAIVLSLHTALTGQANRGRIYLPATTTLTVSPTNVITGGFMSTLNTFAAGVLAIYTSNSLNMCIAKPARAAYTGSTGRQHPARIASTELVTAVVVRDNHFDSTRRRGLR